VHGGLVQELLARHHVVVLGELARHHGGGARGACEAS